MLVGNTNRDVGRHTLESQMGKVPAQHTPADAGPGHDFVAEAGPYNDRRRGDLGLWPVTGEIDPVDEAVGVDVAGIGAYPRQLGAMDDAPEVDAAP